AKVHSYAGAQASSFVTHGVVDGDGASQGHSTVHTVTVNNVAPSITISGNASVNEGSAYSLTLGAVSDPGTDTVSSYVVHWGDGSSDTYSTNGAKSHTYAARPNDYNITVDLVDEDGTFLNRANAFSVHVNNVAPTVSYTSSPASADEGSSKTYSFPVIDPGDDTHAASTGHADCGSGGSLVGGSDSVSRNPAAQAGSFQCACPDGPATSHVALRFTDSDRGTGNMADQQVDVANVAPSIA